MNHTHITTTNLVEALYLLDRGHRIVDVAVKSGMPYGIAELQVTLEGADIDLDRVCYFRTGGREGLERLAQVFSAVMDVVHQKECGGGA